MKQLPRRQEELRNCYDEQAVHFVETRKRPRPEFVHLKSYLAQYIQKRGVWLTILELGCGWGRLYTELQDVLPTQSVYMGVDFAPGMIREAKKTAPQANRQVADMVDYLAEQPQESLDVLLGIASVQHIKWAHRRALFFADAYRALTRWGMMVLTNWSYSQRFLKKYWWQIARTLPSVLFDRDLVRNDVLIPRKDHKHPDEHHMRYYHLFTLYELQQLARHAWFVVRVCQFVGQDGALTDDRKGARNSFLVVEKSVG